MRKGAGAVTGACWDHTYRGDGYMGCTGIDATKAQQGTAASCCSDGVPDLLALTSQVNIGGHEVNSCLDVHFVSGHGYFLCVDVALMLCCCIEI